MVAQRGEDGATSTTASAVVAGAASGSDGSSAGGHSILDVPETQPAHPPASDSDTEDGKHDTVCSPFFVPLPPQAFSIDFYCPSILIKMDFATVRPHEKR